MQESKNKINALINEISDRETAEQLFLFVTSFCENDKITELYKDLTISLIDTVEDEIMLKRLFLFIRDSRFKK